MTDQFGVLTDALSILSQAKQAALVVLIDAVHAERGQAYIAAETWRWVANAYDHILRERRTALGIERRGDPCLPDWPDVQTNVPTNVPTNGGAR